MENVLIVSSGRKSMDYFNDLFSEVPNTFLYFAENASDAKEQFSRSPFDIVIINTPLTDETGYELALHYAEKSGVLLLTKFDLPCDISKQMSDSGILVMKKSFYKSTFFRAINLLKSDIKKENLQKEFEKVRTIDRAKYVLMERLLLSEEQAYSYIKRHAMDMRVTKENVAQAVLYTYGDIDPLKKGIDK